MISLVKKHYSPIGVDIGHRSVKLLQLTGDRSRIVEAARWDLPPDTVGADTATRRARFIEAIQQCCQSHHFHGRDAVVCLGASQLLVQNMRVARSSDAELTRLVTQEAAGRVPYPAAEAEFRYLDAGEIRQGETTKHEVILLACHRPALEAHLKTIQEAGLRPIAVDVEPVALLRCYARQFRRDEDRTQRALFLHVGGANSVIVIAEGATALFIKYLDIGGHDLDDAVARHLGMELDAASLLRRHNGDRRVDQQDPEVTRSVAKAIRPVIDRLANELAMCIRYHSVTFRGQPLVRIVAGGGESSAGLVESLALRIDLPCQLGEPLRTYKTEVSLGRQSQWDVAAGLALREVH